MTTQLAFTQPKVRSNYGVSGGKQPPFWYFRREAFARSLLHVMTRRTAVLKILLLLAASIRTVSMSMEHTHTSALRVRMPADAGRWRSGRGYSSSSRARGTPPEQLQLPHERWGLDANASPRIRSSDLFACPGNVTATTASPASAKWCCFTKAHQPGASRSHHLPPTRPVLLPLQLLKACYAVEPVPNSRGVR